jgi:hypothetical protein
MAEQLVGDRNEYEEAYECIPNDFAVSNKGPRGPYVRMKKNGVSSNNKSLHSSNRAFAAAISAGGNKYVAL